MKVKAPFSVQQTPERARKHIWSWDLYAYKLLNVGWQRVDIQWGYWWEGTLATPAEAIERATAQHGNEGK